MGPGTPRGAELAQRMRGGEPQEVPGPPQPPRRRIDAVGSPGSRARRMAGQHDRVPVRPGQSRQRVEPGPTFPRGQVIVAKDEARSARELRQRVFEGRIVAGIRQQPKQGQGLARAHCLAIAPRMESAATLLTEVEDRIAHACRLAGRERDEVTLVAVSKTHPAQAIEPLIAAGQRVFGENRVQEAEAKWPALRERHPGVELHLVGQLQSNKAEDAVALFDAIHSLDRPSLVTALAKAMDKAGRQVPCFVQVNIGAEPQKGGCAIGDLPALLAEARAAAVPLAGLMCVPPLDVEPAPFFALLDKLARDHGLAGRSMGMSGDFETAIMLGATHVRIGSALFGARPPE